MDVFSNIQVVDVFSNIQVVDVFSNIQVAVSIGGRKFSKSGNIVRAGENEMGWIDDFVDTAFSIPEKVIATVTELPGKTVEHTKDDLEKFWEEFFDE